MYKRFYSTLYKSISTQNLFDSSAVLSFYFILSLFPALIVLFSLISYIPIDSLDNLMSWWLRHLPTEISSLLEESLVRVRGEKSAGILSFGFIFAVWTASTGVLAAMRQLNRSYGAKETRGFIKLRLIAVILSFWTCLLAVGPMIIYSLTQSFLHLTPQYFSSVLMDFLGFGWLRYLSLLGLLLFAFAGVYYFGPNVKQKFKFIIPGSAVGALSLLLGTKAFELYLKYFAAYDKIYGSLGAVIILLIWLYLLGFLLILGGDVNQALRKVSDSSLIT